MREAERTIEELEEELRDVGAVEQISTETQGCQTEIVWRELEASMRHLENELSKSQEDITHALEEEQRARERVRSIDTIPKPPAMA